MKRRCVVCMERKRVWDDLCGACLESWDMCGPMNTDARITVWAARRARRFERARRKRGK